jgi:hypothetical protein
MNIGGSVHETNRLFPTRDLNPDVCGDSIGPSPLSPKRPTWWAKYQRLVKSSAKADHAVSPSVDVGTNVDVSNECTSQSETFITLNPSATSNLAGGSNEIFRLPMRGYFSLNDGQSWGGVDLPLPATNGARNRVFGSDPSLAFDTVGRLFYSYITVGFSPGGAINNTALAVARSTDGGQTYPFFKRVQIDGGESHFNDKPIITVDTNLGSRFRDNVYIAWDAAVGGSTSGGVKVARSSNHGATFSISRIDPRHGPGHGIGADPFVGPDGTLYVAWNDYAANTISFNRSFDGGASWDQPRVVAHKRVPFEFFIPAQEFRGVLVYPACDAGRSFGPHRGSLYCSWGDLTAEGTGDIFLSHSNDGGTTWSTPARIADSLDFRVDRFNHWLSVDSVSGAVTLSFYDTRNDTTGQRFETDIYLAQSTDGGATWLHPNTQVTTVRSNEHDCNGLFPCPGIDYGNQYGDYEGLVAYGGESHPIWTDSRLQLTPAVQPACRRPLFMEEVFTATVR